MIVTEFCERGSLQAFLSSTHVNMSGSFGEILWKILQGAAAGLHFLHQQRIVHRDIRSANILLNGESVPKWCDFALSANVDDLAASFSSSNGSGGGSGNKSATNGLLQGVGALRWMAPEVFCGTAAHGFAADIWAFGMMIVEMVAGGSPPFSHLSPALAALAASERVRPWRRKTEAATEESIVIVEDEAVALLLEGCGQFDPARRLSTHQLSVTIEGILAAITAATASKSISPNSSHDTVASAASAAAKKISSSSMTPSTEKRRPPSPPAIVFTYYN